MNNNFLEFIKRWNDRANEIKKQKLSSKFCVDVYAGFIREFLCFKIHNTDSVNLLEREKVSNDLKFALMIANINYDTYMRKNSWWYRFFSGKKEFNLFKKPI